MTRALATLFICGLMLLACCKRGPTESELKAAQEQANALKAELQALQDKSARDQERKSEYLDDLMTVGRVMAGTGSAALKACEVHYLSWRQAYYLEGRSDLDAVTRETLKKMVTPVAEIERSRDSIAKQVQALANPPQGFEAAHAKLISAYGIFTEIVRQATSPSGSIESYQNFRVRAEGEFTRALQELRALIPE